MSRTLQSAPRALVVAASLLATAVGVTAQELSPAAKAGRTKAQACATCHGPLGIASVPDAPNLAGQPAIYVATQLRAYRSGARKHEVMNVMAKPLSDDDIDQLAAWYAAIKVEAKAP